MAQKLVLPTKFLNSDALPEVCLFSGRTDSIKQKSMSFSHLNAGYQIVLAILFLVIGLLVILPYYFMRTLVVISIPQADGEKFKWSMKRQFWAVVMFIVPGLSCVIAAWIPQSSQNIGAIVAIGGVLLGLVVGIGLGIWGTLTTVSIKMVDPDTFEFKFPESQSATYSRYSEAYETWRLERRGTQRPKSNDDDNDWADGDGGAASNWDQGKRKPKA